MLTRVCEPDALSVPSDIPVPRQRQRIVPRQPRRCKLRCVSKEKQMSGGFLVCFSFDVYFCKAGQRDFPLPERLAECLRETKAVCNI